MAYTDDIFEDMHSSGGGGISPGGIGPTPGGKKASALFLKIRGVVAEADKTLERTNSGADMVRMWLEKEEITPELQETLNEITKVTRLFTAVGKALEGISCLIEKTRSNLQEGGKELPTKVGATLEQDMLARQPGARDSFEKGVKEECLSRCADMLRQLLDKISNPQIPAEPAQTLSNLEKASGQGGKLPDAEKMAETKKWIAKFNESLHLKQEAFGSMIGGGKGWVHKVREICEKLEAPALKENLGVIWQDLSWRGGQPKVSFTTLCGNINKFISDLKTPYIKDLEELMTVERERYLEYTGGAISTSPFVRGSWVFDSWKTLCADLNKYLISKEKLGPVAEARKEVNKIISDISDLLKEPLSVPLKAWNERWDEYHRQVPFGKDTWYSDVLRKLKELEEGG